MREYPQHDDTERHGRDEHQATGATREPSATDISVIPGGRPVEVLSGAAVLLGWHGKLPVEVAATSVTSQELYDDDIHE